jgi:hypothetical protein
MIKNKHLPRVAIVGLALGLTSLAQAADYASVSAATEAVTGSMTATTTAFLAAATLGVGVFLIRIAVRAVKRGLSIG